MVRLNADQLRKGEPGKGRETVKRNEIYLVLDNVLDTYNIGSIFRLADAVAAKKVYLCGATEIPPNPRIKKASINTTEWVSWSYKEDVLSALKEIKKSQRGVQILAIEQSKNSIQYDKFNYKLPVCLIVGHESDGVSKKVLQAADVIVEIPMYGINKSLNVMVSLGIVLFEVMKYL